jgi:hypothetical protein
MAEGELSWSRSRADEIVFVESIEQVQRVGRRDVRGRRCHVDLEWIARDRRAFQQPARCGWQRRNLPAHRSHERCRQLATALRRPSQLAQEQRVPTRLGQELVARALVHVGR